MSECKHTPEVEQRIRRLEDETRHNRREFDQLKSACEQMAADWMKDAAKWARAEAKQIQILDAIAKLQTAVENFAALASNETPNGGQ